MRGVSVAFVSLISAIQLLVIVSSASSDEQPQWVWATENRTVGSSICIVRPFELKSKAAEAEIRFLADYCNSAVYINGHRIASSRPFDKPQTAAVAEYLKTGRNTIGVCANKAVGPAAVFFRLEVTFPDGSKQSILSNEQCRWVALKGKSLQWPEIDHTAMKQVVLLGELARFPWGKTTDSITIDPLDDYTQWKKAQGTEVTDPVSFQVPVEFEVELVRAAKSEEGSWVGMAFDPQERVIIAKEKQGLLRFDVSAKEVQASPAELINKDLKECRGLIFAHGGLYAMANNDKALYFLRDADDDDSWETVQKLKEFPGDVGHGRNEITVGPDGQLYAIFGDSIFEPDDMQKRPPSLSHPTAHEQTRSGFVARWNRKQDKWTVHCRGLRNPYGIALNADGEIFTYDADAEYDMGAPWYRPTRIDHLISGADFGWRRVTKAWPPYIPDRPDMPRPTVDIGKGSPTSVTFGYGSQFPAPYRTALYALDWAYGRILAVHLEPHGSSYAAKAETFLRGRPANVTDVEFGPDGAMYFTTGGRGTQSALYRVRYIGPTTQPLAVTTQQAARAEHAKTARQLRRSLEAYHGNQSPDAIQTAWKHLASSDPWIRHSARIAIEWQPVDQWKSRALEEPLPSAALSALLALVRVCPTSVHSEIINRLNDLPLGELSDKEKMSAIFIYQRCLQDAVLIDRHGQSVLGNLNGLYPDESSIVNRSLGLLLSRLDAPDFVEDTIKLLDAASSQQERLQFLFVLRDVKVGWTKKLRRRYFGHLASMVEFVGGDGMPTFQRLIREEAFASVPESERPEFEQLVEASNVETLLTSINDEKREFVREWEMADLEQTLAKVGRGRNFEQGRKMFTSAKCMLCHRIQGQGGVLGPDLSSAASRFTPRDMLTSMIKPSKTVAEKYRSHTFVLADGRVITGQIVPGGDFRSPNLRVMTDPLDPRKIAEFPKLDVEQSEPAKVSPMPKGLLNTLSEEEILDLLAYLSSGGNERSPAFSK